jgi:hypothetical protein
MSSGGRKDYIKGMAGKFLKRAAIVDLVKSEQRTNAIRKRAGLGNRPITAVVCGCPDPSCGGWHDIRADRTIPTAEEAKQTLAEGQKSRKASKRWVKKSRQASKRRRKTP